MIDARNTMRRARTFLADPLSRIRASMPRWKTSSQRDKTDFSTLDEILDVDADSTPVLIYGIGNRLVPSKKLASVIEELFQKELVGFHLPGHRTTFNYFVKNRIVFWYFGLRKKLKVAYEKEGKPLTLITFSTSCLWALIRIDKSIPIKKIVLIHPPISLKPTTANALKLVLLLRLLGLCLVFNFFSLDYSELDMLFGLLLVSVWPFLFEEQRGGAITFILMVKLIGLSMIGGMVNISFEKIHLESGLFLLLFSYFLVATDDGRIKVIFTPAIILGHFLDKAAKRSYETDFWWEGDFFQFLYWLVWLTLPLAWLRSRISDEFFDFVPVAVAENIFVLSLFIKGLYMTPFLRPALARKSIIVLGLEDDIIDLNEARRFGCKYGFDLAEDRNARHEIRTENPERIGRLAI